MAMLNHAYFASYAADAELNRQALAFFAECHRRHPRTWHGERALLALISMAITRGEPDVAKSHAAAYRRRYQQGAQMYELFERYQKRIEELEEKDAKE